jgi:hypothetical protein
MPTNVPPNLADDLTPLDSPLDFAPEAYGSPGESLGLIRADSSIHESPSAELECPGHGRCAGQQGPCEICQRDKKEVSPGRLFGFRLLSRIPSWPVV